MIPMKNDEYEAGGWPVMLNPCCSFKYPPVIHNCRTLYCSIVFSCAVVLSELAALARVLLRDFE